MKRFIALLLTAILLLTFAACGGKKAAEAEPAKDPAQSADAGQTSEAAQSAGMANPMVEVESLDAINEQFGCNMVHPPVMGITDEKFYSIAGTVAQYDFSVNGQPYTLRFSPDFTSDISGIYIANGNTIFTGIDGDAVVAMEGYRAARWLDVNGQYVLSTTDDVDAGIFADIADEIQNLTFPGMSKDERAAIYASMEGAWADRMSQRASAEITPIGDAVYILVHWSSSYAEGVEWEMTAKFSEDGLLSYKDCTKSEYKFENANSDPVYTVIYEDGEGFFSYGDDGILYWNGAAEEDCQACEFEYAN